MTTGLSAALEGEALALGANEATSQAGLAGLAAAGSGVVRAA